MTKEEFLLDTLEYYSGHLERRCEADGVCKYSPKAVNKQGKTEGCAIGRHLSEEGKLAFDNLPLNGITHIRQDYPVTFAKYAPLWMQEMDTFYLSAIQALHDSDDNWTDKGLSYYGKREVKTIIENFSLSNPEQFDKYLNQQPCEETTIEKTQEVVIPSI